MAANNIIQYQKWFGRVFRVIWGQKKNCHLISHRNRNTLWILEVIYVVARTNSCYQKFHDFLSRPFDIICKNALGLTSFVSAIHVLSKKWTRTELDFFFGLNQSKTPPKMAFGHFWDRLQVI
jgi:hypothetical protein